MGGGGAFAGAGAADLGHDHRLADLGGAARGGDELVHVADALDEQQDNVGRGILHHVVEEFAGAQIRLVAGADHIAKRDPERLGAVVDGKSDPAALRDDAYPPGARDQPLLIGLDVDCRTKSGGDALELVVKSFRIRAQKTYRADAAFSTILLLEAAPSASIHFPSWPGEATKLCFAPMSRA